MAYTYTQNPPKIALECVSAGQKTLLLTKALLLLLIFIFFLSPGQITGPGI